MTRVDIRRGTLDLLHDVEMEERRRSQLQRQACRTCGDWADVIHMQTPSRLIERWHKWPAPDHRCPACGREPTVFVSRWAFEV